MVEVLKYLIDMVFANLNHLFFLFAGIVGLFVFAYLIILYAKDDIKHSKDKTEDKIDEQIKELEDNMIDGLM